MKGEVWEKGRTNASESSLRPSSLLLIRVALHVELSIRASLACYASHVPRTLQLTLLSMIIARA